MKTKGEKALKTLRDPEEIRGIYDYDLLNLKHIIEEEMAKRDKKRKEMINCLEDMCRYLRRNDITEHTFYYSSDRPKNLLEADDDEITDEGYNIIRYKLKGKTIATFKYDGSIFRIKSRIIKKEGHREGEFQLEEICKEETKEL